MCVKLLYSFIFSEEIELFKENEEKRGLGKLVHLFQFLSYGADIGA